MIGLMELRYMTHLRVVKMLVIIMRVSIVVREYYSDDFAVEINYLLCKIIEWQCQLKTETNPVIKQRFVTAINNAEIELEQLKRGCDADI
jgi:hypothetical protein